MAGAERGKTVFWGAMVFLVFASLGFLVLRLSLRWRWRSVLIAAAIIGFAADALLEHWVVPH